MQPQSLLDAWVQYLWSGHVRLPSLVPPVLPCACPIGKIGKEGLVNGFTPSIAPPQCVQLKLSLKHNRYHRYFPWYDCHSMHISCSICALFVRKATFTCDSYTACAWEHSTWLTQPIEQLAQFYSENSKIYIYSQHTKEIVFFSSFHPKLNIYS